MKNSWNLLIILSITFGMASVCPFGGNTEPNSFACITEDKKTIGVGITGKVLTLDAESGKLLKDVEKTQAKGAVVCSAKNEVLAVYAEEIQNIETGKKTPRRIAGSTVLGVNSENNLVGFYGTTLSNRAGKTLDVFVEKHDDQSDDLKKFTLDLEKLDAVQRNKSSFLTKPVKLLENNELLVFAGGNARTIPKDEEADMNPDIWGFYKVNLENGDISRTKAIDKGDYETSVFRLPITDATTDGKFVAAAFSNSEGKVVVVYDLMSGEEVFRHKFFENKATGRSYYQLSRYKAIALSNDGKTLAIAGVWGENKGRTFSTETVVTIFDLQSKEKLNDFKFDEEISEIIEFRNDAVFINFDNKSIGKINAQDGKAIWQTKLTKR